MRTSMPERWSEEFCISNAVLQEASGDFSRLVWYVRIFLYWWLDGQRHSAHVAIFAVNLLGGRRVMHCSSQSWKWRMHVQAAQLPYCSKYVTPSWCKHQWPSANLERVLFQMPSSVLKLLPFGRLEKTCREVAKSLGRSVWWVSEMGTAIQA